MRCRLLWIGLLCVTLTTCSKSEPSFPSVAPSPHAQLLRSEFSGRLCADAIFYFGQVFDPYGPVFDPRGPYYLNLCLPNDPLEQHHFVGVHREGTLVVGLDWEYHEDYSAEYMRLSVQCDSARVDQLWIKGPAGPPLVSDYDPTQRTPPIPLHPRPQPLQVSVPAASMCEIKPWAYFSFKTVVPATQYHLTIDHPR